MAKKTAFTVQVDVPASTLIALVEGSEVYLSDVHDLTISLSDHPGVRALIEKNVKFALTNMANDFYFDDVIDEDALDKLFKKEIKTAQAKYAANREAEEKQARERIAATAGVLRMHIDKLAEARKVLKAAGIDVAA